MPYVKRLHWEHGEDHPEMSNIDTPLPISDGVSAADSYSGTYCHHVEFGAGDDWTIYDLDASDRAATATPVLFGCALKLSSLTALDWDIKVLSVVGRGSSTTYINLAIQANGSIAVIGPATGISSTTPLLGATAAGVIQPDTWHYISVRVVFDNSVGEVQIHVDGVEVFNQTGIDTWYSGSIGTLWGWGATFQAATAGTGDLWLDDIVLAEDMAAPFPPQLHEALVPTGVTASNDGTVFGGAPNAAAATDEIPGTSADGFTLDAVNDLQGLSFPSRAGSGTITGVQVWGQVGDAAAGSEELVCDLNDGTATESGSAIALGTSFVSRALTALLNDPPSGGSWDDTKLDALTVEFERTA